MKLNKKGIAPLVTVACWLVGAFVVGGTAGNKSAEQRITEKCVSNGGVQETCKADAKAMSFRNKMLALQK